jgi:hypothetical protein
MLIFLEYCPFFPTKMTGICILARARLFSSPSYTDYLWGGLPPFHSIHRGVMWNSF